MSRRSVGMTLCHRTSKRPGSSSTQSSTFSPKKTSIVAISTRQLVFPQLSLRTTFYSDGCPLPRLAGQQNLNHKIYKQESGWFSPSTIKDSTTATLAISGSRVTHKRDMLVIGEGGRSVRDYLTVTAIALINLCIFLRIG